MKHNCMHDRHVLSAIWKAKLLLQQKISFHIRSIQAQTTYSSLKSSMDNEALSNNVDASGGYSLYLMLLQTSTNEDIEEADTVIWRATDEVAGEQTRKHLEYEDGELSESVLTSCMNTTSG